MYQDNKEWHQAQVEQIEEVAYDLAEGGRYHYFEDFIDRLIETTNAIEIFFDSQSVKDYFREIYRENYKSIGGV